ncbi:MAG TPA: hypothetical protein VMP08_25345 [Anaerolineae bacterium]|nr:hypothetical protein [Anaerolineae bacterium]
MKRQVKFFASSVLLVAVMTFALAGAARVQAAASTTQIAVENQNVDTGVVVIDSVTAAQDGWVVIYKNPNLNSTDIVGHAWVHQGVNPGVKVIVNMSAIGNPPTLWAAFLADNTDPSVRQNWGPNGLPGSAAQSTPAALTAFATTGNAGTVTSSAKAIADGITVHNQDISSGLALIDSVTTNQDGWVVLYRSPNFDPGNIVGYAPVYRGTNTDLLVKVDANKVKDQPTLWAQLHADAGIQNVFEWGNSVRLADGTSIQVFNDYPVIQNNGYIRASFATTASPATASTPSSKSKDQISIGNQSLNTGVIVIDSVTAAQDGWVVLYRSPNFGPGDIVGYAPVYQGTNYGVKVTVDTARLKDQPPELWARLHVDQGIPNIFEWGYQGRAFADPPVFPSVVAGFGTNGP